MKKETLKEKVIRGKGGVETLEEEAQRIKEEGAKEESEQLRCPKCGNTVKADHNSLCNNCI